VQSQALSAPPLSSLTHGCTWMIPVRAIPAILVFYAIFAGLSWLLDLSANQRSYLLLLMFGLCAIAAVWRSRQPIVLPSGAQAALQRKVQHLISELLLNLPGAEVRKFLTTDPNGIRMLKTFDHPMQIAIMAQVLLKERMDRGQLTESERGQFLNSLTQTAAGDR
jgi:hypothetical protein